MKNQTEAGKIQAATEITTEATQATAAEPQCTKHEQGVPAKSEESTNPPTSSKLARANPRADITYKVYNNYFTKFID